MYGHIVGPEVLHREISFDGKEDHESRQCKNAFSGCAASVHERGMGVYVDIANSVVVWEDRALLSATYSPEVTQQSFTVINILW